MCFWLVPDYSLMSYSNPACSFKSNGNDIGIYSATDICENTKFPNILEDSMIKLAIVVKFIYKYWMLEEILNVRLSNRPAITFEAHPIKFTNNDGSHKIIRPALYSEGYL